MFSEILNPFINVRNKIRNSEGLWVDKKIPREQQFQQFINKVELSENGVILFNTKNKVIIDSFQFGATSASFIRPRLTIKREFDYNHAYQNNVFLAINGKGNYYEATFTYINSFGHPLLESTVHNTSERHYKMQNKVPIVLPEGGKLGVYPSDGYDPTTHDFSVSVVYREIEVL